MTSATVKANYLRAGGVRVLAVPAWVRNPTVLPRQDGVDAIDIEMTRRYANEQWMIIHGPSAGMAIAFCLLGGGRKMVNEPDVQMTVMAPLGIYANLQIRRVQGPS